MEWEQDRLLEKYLRGGREVDEGFPSRAKERMFMKKGGTSTSGSPCMVGLSG